MPFRLIPTLGNAVSNEAVPRMDRGCRALTRLRVCAARLDVHFNDVIAHEAHGGYQAFFVR